MKLGTYVVSEVLQAGWEQTFPAAPGTHTVSLTPGPNSPIAFGNKEEPCCLSFRVPGGVADNFSLTNGPELTWRSPALAAAMASYPTADFDETRMDRHFGHTLALPQGNCIASARLTIRAKPLAGATGLATNDTLSLSFTGVAGAPGWSSYFGSGNSSPGLLPTAWHTGNYPAGQIFTYDLSNLPGGVDLLSQLESNRFIDVRVQDDTAIDFVTLSVVFCECEGESGNPVPLPPAKH